MVAAAAKIGGEIETEVGGGAEAEAKEVEAEVEVVLSDKLSMRCDR